MTVTAFDAPILRAPDMVSNAFDRPRELTSEEVALIGGGSFWGGLNHFIHDVVKGAGEGEIAGAVTGAVTGGAAGVGIGALAGSIGGAIYGAFNFLG